MNAALYERIAAHRAVKIDFFRHGRIFYEICDLLDGHADQDTAKEWRSELLLQWAYHQRLDKLRPAYRYFETRTAELIQALQQAWGDSRAVDRALERRKALIAALPEAAPDLDMRLALHIKAALGDKGARATLAEEPRF